MVTGTAPSWVFCSFSNQKILYLGVHQFEPLCKGLDLIAVLIFSVFATVCGGSLLAKWQNASLFMLALFLSPEAPFIFLCRYSIETLSINPDLSCPLPSSIPHIHRPDCMPTFLSSYSHTLLSWSHIFLILTTVETWWLPNSCLLPSWILFFFFCKFWSFCELTSKVIKSN